MTQTKIDRNLQLEILQHLEKQHPQECDLDRSLIGVDDNGAFKEIGEDKEWALASNIVYLGEHGLLDANVKPRFGGFQLGKATITAKGQDFLADDGGLSAILNTVTIRLEADQLRAILESKINHADLPPAKKTEILETLRALPSEAVKILTKRLLEELLSSLPDAGRIIQKCLGLIL